MYFVDRDKIEKTLLYFDGLLQEFGNHSFESFLERLSMERIVHMAVESMLDVGNLMIDGFIMRDPGSFMDIIDILVDEEVLPVHETESYKEIINLRKMLINNYLEIDHELIFETMNKNKSSLDLFSQRIRDYLDNETEVATTFTNSK